MIMPLSGARSTYASAQGARMSKRPLVGQRSTGTSAPGAFKSSRYSAGLLYPHERAESDIEQRTHTC